MRYSLFFIFRILNHLYYSSTYAISSEETEKLYSKLLNIDVKRTMRITVTVIMRLTIADYAVVWQTARQHLSIVWTYRSIPDNHGRRIVVRNEITGPIRRYSINDMSANANLFCHLRFATTSSSYVSESCLNLGSCRQIQTGQTSSTTQTQIRWGEYISGVFIIIHQRCICQLKTLFFRLFCWTSGPAEVTQSCSQMSTYRYAQTASGYFNMI